MTSGSSRSPMSELERALEEHRRRLDALEAPVLAELRARYAAVIERLRAELESLAVAIREAQEAGEELSAEWLHRQARYQRLLEQAEAEFARFAAVGERTLSAAHGAFAQAGTTAATGLIQAAGIAAGFEARLNTVALERLVGALQAGSPLRGVLDSYGQHAAAVIERRLVEGITTGEGARAIVRQIQDELGGAVPQARLASLVRTEGMRAYRAAQIETYRQMGDAVGGWRWSAAHSPRTCAACLAKDDGQVYPLSVPMDKPHIACRCVPIPVPVGMALTPPETGVAWLARQSPEVQRQVLGSRAAVEAYRRGEVALSDFVGERHDPRWGTSVYQKSWREVARATRGAGRRGQGGPIRGVPSPHNPAAVRGPHGIWNEETLPVTDWEAPAYRAVLPQTLLEATGVEIPVLRWAAAKRANILLKRPQTRPLVDSLDTLLPNWSYVGKEPSESEVWHVIFVGEGHVNDFKFGPDRNGSWNVITVHPLRDEQREHLLRSSWMKKREDE